MRTILIAIIAFCVSACNQSKPIKDYKKDLILMRKEMQRKLDTGEWMMQTDRQFMMDTDSVLQLIINDLKETFPEDSSRLNAEQRKWETDRKLASDSLWANVDEVFRETGITPELEREIAYGSIAALNYDRAIELNKKLSNRIF